MADYLDGKPVTAFLQGPIDSKVDRKFTHCRWMKVGQKPVSRGPLEWVSFPMIGKCPLEA